MAKVQSESESRTIELLEKLLVVQLHSMGATQGRIAQIVRKSKTWVNEVLRDVPMSANKK